MLKDVITLGDAMITFNPAVKGPMKYVQSFHRNVGGAELNFAIGCARLGLTTGWISRLGNDEFGRHIMNFVRGEGVDISEVKLMDGYPTSLNFKEIMEDGSGRTFYYREKSPTETLTVESLNEEYIRQAKVLHVTGVFAAIDQHKNVEVIKKACSLAKKHNVLVSLDPNIRLKLWRKEEAKAALTEILPFVDVLLTGTDEAELLFGVTDADDIFAKCREFGIRYGAIKLGSEGSTGFDPDQVVHKKPVKPKKVVDTVGAGDGFDAGFIFGLLQNWDLDKILQFANTIGAMVVSVSGDNEGLPYLEDVLIETGEKEFIER